jgi:hypothetical protein
MLVPINLDDIVKLRPEVENLIQVESSKYKDDDNVEEDKQLALAVYDNIDNLERGWLPTPEHIAKVIVASERNIQFRDFLMGLHTERDTTLVGAYLEVIGGTGKKEQVVPVITVLSTYNFITGDKSNAIDLVKKALEVTPDYSLAKLLDRIFNVMTPEELANMAGQLHPKVKKTLKLTEE